MLLLLETAAGYALFQTKDKSLTKASGEELDKIFEEGNVKIDTVAFSKFKDAKRATEEASALVEGKMGKDLQKFLQKQIVDKKMSDSLGIVDPALAKAVGSKLGIECTTGDNVRELLRNLRINMGDFLDVEEKTLVGMGLGLAHSLSRFKLKFSADKVDIMIIQAVGLLDDLDKELNNLAMRLREWYGWHFPELSKVISDNLLFAKFVKEVGLRTNVKTADLEDGPLQLPEEIAKEVKQAAEISAGTEMTDDDLESVQTLAGRVMELLEYRAHLAEYLKTRMTTLAPNLTAMVGELIGARLISHAGSLVGLAKHPSSTVQILGAEKALFRSLKNKANTPKYGLIFSASLVGQAAPKLKGRVSRTLACKLSLASRIDALGTSEGAQVGIEMRAQVERRLAQLEEQGAGGERPAKRARQ